MSSSNLDGKFGDDTVRAYLKEIGATALLSAAEEIELAQALALGNQAKERLNSGGGIEGDEELVKIGDEARERLTKANLRLVVSIAKSYRGRGLGFQDLIQEGNLGLMRAVEKYDPGRGFRFSTYATWWIRQAIAKGVGEQVRAIRMPAHASELLNEIFRVRRQLVQDLEREPTSEELARAVGTDVHKVNELLQLSRDTLSLESPAGANSESLSLGDLLKDEDSEGQFDALDKEVVSAVVNEALSFLTDREQEIMKYRFGVGSDRPHSIDETSEEHQISRERIRQLEQKAIMRLRDPRINKELKGLLDG
ncbi:MAG: sigma-70 family RNA polymerase sigma factor [Acidimicrobiaceae bacterium]|nr:sigma-70 family RNA polymerase sigma factor [Acidimicrobiaceae bacterium]